jgi:palmitoyltransferase
MHYYYVCTISPGFVDDPLREPGHGIMWAKKRGLKESKALTGVRWSREEGIKITKALATKCRKCGQIKPEVSILYDRENYSKLMECIVIV